MMFAAFCLAPLAFLLPYVALAKIATPLFVLMLISQGYVIVAWFFSKKQGEQKSVNTELSLNRREEAALHR